MKHASKIIRARRGFSFVELLFAIMILGIGFIMIAAIFPVAIKQTAASGEETVASTIAKGAVGVIQQVASNALMPATPGPNGSPVVAPIGPTAPTGETGYGANLWAAINGNMILPSDNRYAWAAMYERDAATTPYAQVIIIGMQVRNRTQYTTSTPGETNLYGDVGFAPASSLPSQPNLQPKQVNVQFTFNSGTAPDTVTFLTTNPVEGANAGAVAEGTYLVVSDDGGTTNRTYNTGYSSTTYPNATCNGYIYRIGNLVSGTTWQLLPGNDIESQLSAPVRPTNGKMMNALIVGRSIHDPGQPFDPSANPYEGLSQDISVYVSFVRINS
jgi:prepilin-type N-terminal cleavage/methylation domain-containing protein